MGLTFKELQKIFSKRYKVNAAESAENIKSFQECIFDKQSRLEWTKAIQNEQNFHEYLDYLESLEG
jgi:hypothetical protein